MPPAELGSQRGFCFRNSCAETIWVGQIGGNTGVKCAVGCPKGSICYPDLGDCFFSLNFPSTKIKLTPGQLYCLPFGYDPVTTTIHMPTGDIHLIVQFSGAIYGSTGCDANGYCETGICANCPSYRGPVGPVSQGEITLSAIWKDYYDLTLIHGANVPLTIKPMSITGSFYPDQWAPPDYHCKGPGNVGANQGGAIAANWRFDLANPGKSQNLVPLVTGGSAKACTKQSDCPTGEMCGGQMQLTSENKPMPNLFDNLCGRPIGVWSRSEMCGWTDALTFGNCKDLAAPNGDTIQHLYKCAGKYAESCFQKITGTSDCCGCSTWDDFIPTHGEPCHHHNPVWETIVMPHLRLIKKACPMCYTFPYDDSTALYTCWNDPSWNDVSYEFEWCPGGSKLQFFDSSK